jgi:hypothetical protein
VGVENDVAEAGDAFGECVLGGVEDVVGGVEGSQRREIDRSQDDPPVAELFSGSSGSFVGGPVGRGAAQSS